MTLCRSIATGDRKRHTHALKKEKIRETVNERRKVLGQQNILLANATTQDLFVLGQINY